MAWYGLINRTTGDLVSVGTEAMFPNGDINAFSATMDRANFNSTQPDFATQRWNSTTRALEPRPAPVLIDRLDDIEAWLMADADFLSVWNTLTQARRTTIRTGIRRVLARVAGGRRFRLADELPELE